MRVTTSKSTAMFLLVPAAALGFATFAGVTGASAASAESAGYEATLAPLNESTASGSVRLTLDGDKATVTEKVEGLAESFMDKPYPHVQHIHIGARGECPTASADKDGDEVVSTTEGDPFYGAIGTTLSLSGDTSPKAGTTLTAAPSGADFDYERTFTLNPDTMAALKAGTAVVVVHGLDPATLSTKAQAAKSDLVPALPLAATSPALCGALVAAEGDGASTSTSTAASASTATAASASPSEASVDSESDGATAGPEADVAAAGAEGDVTAAEGEGVESEGEAVEPATGAETGETPAAPQVAEVPTGGADTGDGTTAGADEALLLASAGLLAAAGGVLAARRFTGRRN